jgi:hypothetical protein
MTLTASTDPLEEGLELALKIFVTDPDTVTVEELEAFLIHVVHMRLRGQISHDLATRLMDKGNTRIAALQIEQHRWAHIAR